ERVTIAAVARPKLPLVVGAPDVVRGEDQARRLPGMADATTLAPTRHHAMPLQDVARRGPAGQDPTRMLLGQQSEELLTTPARVPPTGLQDRGHDLIRRRIGPAPRPARSLLQTGRPVAQIALNPLVPGLTSNPVERAQLGDRQRVAQVIGDELRSLVHG